MVYKRFDAHNEILVMFNVDALEQTYNLPEGDFEDLLSGNKYAGTSIQLKPLSALILRKIFKR